MSWNKVGLVFRNEAKNRYLKSHASNPLAVHIEDNIFRIYYSGRNHENKSSVGFFDYDLVRMKLVSQPSEPSIIYGSTNSFYSHGLSVGCTYNIGKKKYMLFMGWQIRGEAHWRGDIGRLEVLSSGKLISNSDSPFIKFDAEVDKISLSYPWVMFEDGIYKMWYGSTIDWISENGEMIHVINYATSKDGEHWERHGLAIPYILGVAQAFSRPTVIKDNIGYHMWFSYRSGNGTPYRIGYAKSEDGLNWKLALEEVGIDVSNNGWDSEMICYPFVFEHNGERLMLYNGNGFGESGIGIAKWKQ